MTVILNAVVVNKIYAITVPSSAILAIKKFVQSAKRIVTIVESWHAILMIATLKIEGIAIKQFAKIAELDAQVNVILQAMDLDVEIVR